ncbi:MAG: DUF5615 family PIN-like protein [Acidobacteria bacterium]|nr:DUF5615 family PIN-like protein [Acidobacteriota bacterium]
MRVLLDESLPRPLAELLVGHEARTVAQVGWRGLRNGALLQQAATTFDVVLTADQNIEFQQNLKKLPVAVVVLVAETNRIESLAPLVPKILETLRSLEPKILLRVGA